MFDDLPCEKLNKIQRVLQCFYCGNNTLMNLVGEHKYNWDECDGEFHGYYNYQMFSCPVCGKVTFLEQYWDSLLSDQNDNYSSKPQEEILYPANKIHVDYVPPNVKDRYETALKTKNIDSAICLIALRKTLEIICEEKKAKGQSLWTKITDLSKKGILPPELKNASTITKNYGNIGAHGENIYISPFELDLNINFVQYIIDYLYILPAKLDEAQKKLKTVKSNNHASGEKTL